MANAKLTPQQLCAIQYAEKYGIVKYRLNGWILIYNVSYPAYLNNPRYTVQHKVDLRTGKESSRVLSRYDFKGEINR